MTGLGPLSTAEAVVFWGLALGMLAATPVLVAHVRGTTEVVDDASRLMATSARFRARLAGGMHLTWASVLLGSVAAILDGRGALPATRVVAVPFVVAMIADVVVFATGRPWFLLLRRHRHAATRPPEDR
jgi:hypothetical protein